MKTYAYGHDFGNSETCGVVIDNGEKRSKVIPSYTGLGSSQGLTNLGVHLRKDDFIFSTDTTEFFVGQLALRQASMPSSGINDIGRYWSERSLHLLLTCAASLIEDRVFGLSVVTGLPVATYVADQESRKAIRRALEGSHVFKLNGVERVVHVTISRVIMEGAGAAIIYGIPGKVRQGVIDIGGRTTDLFASSGQEPLQQYCKGAPIGVETAGGVLGSRFQSMHGRPLTDEEVRDILRGYSNGKIEPVYANGMPVTGIKELAREAINSTGSRIVSFIRSKWNESEAGNVASSFAQVVLIGGGAHYFKKHIEQIFPHVVIPANPEQANATGYASMADRLAQKQQSNIA